MATVAPPANPLPETRLRASAVLTWPRYRPSAAEVADSVWENSHSYDGIASGSIYFLSRDPAVSLTRSPYGYVHDNPLNATDPSGLIDPGLLSDAQKQQIKNECSSWQNSSLCRQAAFCTGDACHTIGQIAMNDNYLVQAALQKSPCGNVTLEGGYQATHAEAERDLLETYQAFAVANETISYENHQATCDTARDLGLLTIIVGGGLTGGEAVGAFAEGSAAFDAGEYAEAASNYLKAGVISQHTVGFTLAGGALMGAFGGGC